MKRSLFISLFCGAHIVAIVAHIHQQSQFTKGSFEKQKKETANQLLVKKKQELSNTLYALHNQTEIKKFACEKLNMKPIKLSQIKKLHDNDESV